MKRGVLVLLLFCFVTVSCSSDLSRSRAKDLIEKSKSQFPAPISISFPLIIDVWDVPFTPDELSRQTSTLENLPKMCCIDARIAYLLSRKHILRLASLSNSQRPPTSWGPNYVRSVGTFRYTFNPSPDLSVVTNSFGQNDQPQVSIVLGRPTLDRVTGITGTGENQRIAEAQFTFTRTTAYLALKESIDEITRTNGDLGAYTDNWTHAFYAQFLAATKHLESPVSTSYSFTKYDDGWRLDSN